MIGSLLCCLWNLIVLMMAYSPTMTTLPHKALRWLKADGTVAWLCEGPHQCNFSLYSTSFHICF